MLEQLFTSFGFRALWTPELIVILLIVAWAYFRLIRVGQTRFQQSEPVTFRQKFYFLTGLFALYLGWGSPLYIAGHLMISFHMTQMVFAYFIAVPLFLLGMPKWVILTIKSKVEKTPFAKVGAIIMSPLVGVLLFNGMFSIYHVPAVFNFLMQSVALHSIYEFGLLISASLMWWHMLAPIPTKKTLSDLRRIGYIFANGVLITPACALIIFAGTPLYSVYTDPVIWATVMAYCLPANAEIPLSLFTGDNTFSPIDATYDQQLAGIVMKIMQEMTYGITIGYVFKQWISKEKQSDGPSISDIPENYVPRPTK